MARPTPMKDAAVNRSAKSITQLTLCQVTTSEVDAATKLLDKACQKLQGIQNIPLQRSLTSKLPYANFAKLTAFWIASSEELNAQISPRTDEEHNLHTMKTIGKSTRVRGLSSNPGDYPSEPATVPINMHRLKREGLLSKSVMIGKALLSGL